MHESKVSSNGELKRAGDWKQHTHERKKMNQWKQ